MITSWGWKLESMPTIFTEHVLNDVNASLIQINGWWSCWCKVVLVWGGPIYIAMGYPFLMYVRCVYLLLVVYLSLVWTILYPYLIYYYGQDQQNNCMITDTRHFGQTPSKHKKIFYMKHLPYCTTLYLNHQKLQTLQTTFIYRSLCQFPRYLLNRSVLSPDNHNTILK